MSKCEDLGSMTNITNTEGKSAEDVCGSIDEEEVVISNLNRVSEFLYHWGQKSLESGLSTDLSGSNCSERRPKGVTHQQIESRFQKFWKSCIYDNGTSPIFVGVTEEQDFRNPNLKICDQSCGEGSVEPVQQNSSPHTQSGISVNFKERRNS